MEIQKNNLQWKQHAVKTSFTDVLISISTSFSFPNEVNLTQSNQTFSYFTAAKWNSLVISAQVQVHFWKNLSDKNQLSVTVVCITYNMRKWKNIFSWSVSATCESLYIQSLYKHKAICLFSVCYYFIFV